jgi:lysine 6-dehydrogenase
MARTTGYTAAITARMVGRGEITEKGLVPPVRVIRGDLFLKLMRELRERGILVKQMITTSSTL